MKAHKYIILLLNLLLLSGCGSKHFDNADQLHEYINHQDNGYTRQVQSNGVNFSVTYRPTDLLVNQEADEENDADQIAKLREKYRKNLYFNLSISKNNKEILSTAVNNRRQFGAMTSQLVFGMQNKVHLLTAAKDTLEMIDYVYPRMYGASKATTIMFVYPRDAKYLEEEFLEFTIKDLGIGTGDINLKIPTQSLRNEPTLFK